MDAKHDHPALDQAVAWPSLRMWARWEGKSVGLVSLAPTRGAQAEQVLIPCDAALLIQLGRISLGSSRASLYVARLTDESAD
ncbi:hypothetical protein [Streptomyces atratus]|uniref:hypothetical protein n=1 Tax=Streptomyces atratus TaxID=1893 RepID=UPI00167180C0|nr:hypothetical protein [Streptomyces atratus]